MLQLYATYTDSRSALSRLSQRLQRTPNRVESAQTVFGDPETSGIKSVTNYLLVAQID